MNAVEKGDVVKAKDGDTAMTVESVIVKCIWFEGADLHSKDYNINELERSEPTTHSPAAEQEEHSS